MASTSIDTLTPQSARLDCVGHVAVAQKHVPKWHLGKWSRRLLTCVALGLKVLSHTHVIAAWSARCKAWLPLCQSDAGSPS